jgi:urate oxidase
MQVEISYGKQQITLYRTYAQPLVGLSSIPESPFVGRENIMLAAEIGVDVPGDNFLAAYTEGDNRDVVATDTMKNFVLRESLSYGGATLEGLLDFLGRRFLATYPQMQRLNLSARELPFSAVLTPEGAAFAPSSVLFSRGHGDASTAELSLDRAGEQVVATAQRSGRVGLQLIKITGSSFANFARDGYTTLEERPDRALFTFMDLHWRYADPALALGQSPAQYVAAEQVRDIAAVVFHEFVSLSIQHLVHEIGQRIFARFPQLAEVSFAAQNRTWDTAASAAEGPAKAYTDPRPGHGQIGLTMRRAG